MYLNFFLVIFLRFVIFLFFFYIYFDCSFLNFIKHFVLLNWFRRSTETSKINQSKSLCFRGNMEQPQHKSQWVLGQLVHSTRRYSYSCDKPERLSVGFVAGLAALGPRGAEDSNKNASWFHAAPRRRSESRFAAKPTGVQSFRHQQHLDPASESLGLSATGAINRTIGKESRVRRWFNFRPFALTFTAHPICFSCDHFQVSDNCMIVLIRLYCNLIILICCKNPSVLLEGVFVVFLKYSCNTVDWLFPSDQC